MLCNMRSAKGLPLTQIEVRSDLLTRILNLVALKLAH
jgi:hypothetical protein